MMLTSWRTAPRRPPSPRRMRRHGRRWPWLAALVPLAAGGFLWLQRDRGPHASVAVAAPAPLAPSGVGFAAPQGERTTGARCLMVVIDESSSMSDADSAGTRADAVTAAGDFLAAYGIAGDRIGATWFAEVADVSAPASPAAGRSLQRDTGYLGSSTLIAPALNATLAAMAGSPTSTGCGTAGGVIVLVSDGAAAGGSDFEGVRAVLAQHPDVAVHLIAMNEGGAFEASRDFWQDPGLGLASVQTIDSFGRGEVATAVAAVLSTETGQRVTAS